MKTDPRVKSRTQKSADVAISQMLQYNRGLKPKWTPKPETVIQRKTTTKKKKYKKVRKTKPSVSVDTEVLKVLGLSFMCFCAVSIAFYSMYENFVRTPVVRVMPELDK